MRGRQAPAALLMDRPDRSLPLIVALLTVFVVPVVNPLGAQAAFELRYAPLPGGATLALRLDACATVGPLVQVRHHDDRLRFSLAPEDLGLACAAPTSGVGSAAEGLMGRGLVGR